MYEAMGWIRLAESTVEIDEGGMDLKILALEEMIQSFPIPSGKIEIVKANFTTTLSILIAPPRRRGEAHLISRILEFVASEFAGAYGIVHEYDEQSSTQYGKGIFSVTVIKRGRIERLLDPFLSPLVPVCEDPS